MVTIWKFALFRQSSSFRYILHVYIYVSKVGQKDAINNITLKIQVKTKHLPGSDDLSWIQEVKGISTKTDLVWLGKC